MRSSAIAGSTPARFAGVLLAAGLLLTGCASSPDAAPGATETEASPEPALSGELTIYAAASLKAAFDELAVQFEEANPDVDVLPVNYDGSSTLATQVIEGAAVDVFASADENNMTKVVDAGLATDPQLFATNTLVIVVPTGNPGGVEGLADLADDSLTVVLCAPEVPCGAASQTLLGNADLLVNADSYEQNVTAVLTKVAADEADAGLVYVTDAATTDDVETVETEGAENVVNRYPIVALDDAPNAEAAAAFAEFVRGPEGQRVLAGLGFGAP